MKVSASVLSKPRGENSMIEDKIRNNPPRIPKFLPTVFPWSAQLVKALAERRPYTELTDGVTQAREERASMLMRRRVLWFLRKHWRCALRSGGLLRHRSTRGCSGKCCLEVGVQRPDRQKSPRFLCQKKRYRDLRGKDKFNNTVFHAKVASRRVSFTSGALNAAQQVSREKQHRKQATRQSSSGCKRLNGCCDGSTIIICSCLITPAVVLRR